MSIVSDVIKIVTGVTTVAARMLGFKKAPPFIALRGPMHAYPTDRFLEDGQYGFERHTCVKCGRYDQDETPYTNPPCPGHKNWVEA